jgi:ferrous iron transport protein A
MKVKTIADLKIGEKGVIASFTDEWMSLKLLEMGCLPDSEVKLCCIAPLGDPICIKVCDYCLSLRKAEASTVILK